MPERKTERVSIRLTKTLRRRLERLAVEDRRKLASLIEIILEEHVNRKNP